MEYGLRSGFTLQFDLGSKDLPWFAVAVLLFAVALLMNRTWLSHLGEAEIWNLMWPSALLAWGVSGLWKKITGWSVGLTLLGIYTLLGQMGFHRWIPVVKGGFLIPVVLILWAGSMLADHFRKGGRGTKHRGEKKEFTSHCAAADGVLQYEASFGDDRQAVECEVFCGGKADVSFGNFSLDLTGCGSVRPGSVLELDVSFGQLTLYLPRTWRVQEQSDRSFAAVTTHSAPNPDADQLLTIRSDVSFASLDIRWD